MFRATPSIVSAVSSFAGKDARPCITFPQDPLRTSHQYHDYWENNINECGLKGWISVRIAVCFVTGRTLAPALTENRRSYRCGFHPEFSNLARSAKPLTRIWKRWTRLMKKWHGQTLSPPTNKWYRKILMLLIMTWKVQQLRSAISALIVFQVNPRFHEF